MYAYWKLQIHLILIIINRIVCKAATIIYQNFTKDVGGGKKQNKQQHTPFLPCDLLVWVGPQPSVGLSSPCCWDDLSPWSLVVWRWMLSVELAALCLNQAWPSRQTTEGVTGQNSVDLLWPVFFNNKMKLVLLVLLVLNRVLQVLLHNTNILLIWIKYYGSTIAWREKNLSLKGCADVNFIGH